MGHNHDISIKTNTLRCWDPETSINSPKIVIFENRWIFGIENMGEFSQKNRDFMNFQFLINRPIRPIFMIYKLENVSLCHFDPFPRYCTYNPQIDWKIEFFGLKYGFLAYFETSICGFFVEISTGIEISTVKNISKKTYDVGADPL